MTLFDTVSICNGDTYLVNNSVYTNSGDYIDSIINSNGCLSFIYTNLTVGDSLIVTISQLGSVLESTVSGGFMLYDYLWNNFANTPNININSNGLYWLVITDSLSCPNDTVFYDVTDFNTSVSELGFHDINIYPNPSRDIFNIEFSSFISQDIQLRIINFIGDIVFVDNLENYIGQYKKKVSLKEYSKAIYFLEIQSDKGIVNKKLILQEII